MNLHRRIERLEQAAPARDIHVAVVDPHRPPREGSDPVAIPTFVTQEGCERWAGRLPDTDRAICIRIVNRPSTSL